MLVFKSRFSCTLQIRPTAATISCKPFATLMTCRIKPRGFSASAAGALNDDASQEQRETRDQQLIRLLVHEVSVLQASLKQREVSLKQLEVQLALAEAGETVAFHRRMCQSRIYSSVFFFFECVVLQHHPSL